MILRRYHTRNHIRKTAIAITAHSSYTQTGSDLVNFNYSFELQNASTEEVKNKNLLSTQEKATVIRFYLTSDCAFHLASKHGE